MPAKHAESVENIRTPTRCFAIRAADKLVHAGAEGVRSCTPLEFAKKRREKGFDMLGKFSGSADSKL